MLRHVSTQCLLVSAGVLVWGFGARAEVVIETVPVGNPGNAGELSGAGAPNFGPERICGAVDYVYSIGTFEVTAGQYVEFLSAVAATDTYGLYNPIMDSDSLGCQITQHGGSGSYTYDFSGGTVEAPGSTAADWENRPVNYVSWGDAARFANWLHNGQPSGAQNVNTTEDGSYYLNGATTDGELIAVVREDDATWVIPSEDEWYKAAHYDGGSGVYYDYATSSDSVPSNDLIAPDPGNNATFYEYGYTIGSPYYRTEVGVHEHSERPYGTFDQGGNVWEWNEAIISGPYRGLRGGSFLDNGTILHAANRYNHAPTFESDLPGFRVAKVSEHPCDRDCDEYAAVFLGAPPATRALDVNIHGEVVGHSINLGMPAFIWLPKPAYGLDAGYHAFEPQDGFLGISASALNDSGLVVGSYLRVDDDDSVTSAYVWEDGIMTRLPPMMRSAAGGANNTGEVVGLVKNEDVSESYGAVWRKNSHGTWDLSLLPAASHPPGFDQATSINDTGDAVGYSHIIGENEYFVYPAYWSEGNVARFAVRARFKEVNNHGHVVGYTLEPCSWGSEEYECYHAKLWDASGTILANLLGTEEALAFDINSHDEIVGTALTGDITGGFLWRDGIAIDPSARIVRPSAVRRLAAAYGVNDLGQIVGWCSPDSGAVSACLLTPVRLDCNANGLLDQFEDTSADCNGDGRWDPCDIALRTSYDCNANGSPDECELLLPGDCDWDGKITLADFGCLQHCFRGFEQWPSTCLCVFDLDASGSVGPDEVATFVSSITGP